MQLVSYILIKKTEKIRYKEKVYLYNIVLSIMLRIQKKTFDTENTPNPLYNSADQFKKQLIDYIYSSVNISKFKYELLQFDSELSQLLKQKYFVSVNFSGSNCLLIFTKIKDKYYSYLIDRKTLSYDVQRIDISKVKTTNIKVKLDHSVYLGTIFDGIYIQNKDEKLFVITDIYMFRGEDFTNTHLDTKLLTIFSYLKSNYDDGDKDNNIILSVNKLFDFEKTSHLINTVIPNMKNTSIRGICFYPEISGTKLIYLFGNEDRSTENAYNQTNLNNSTNLNTVSQRHTLSNFVQPEQQTQNIAKTPAKVVRTIYVPKKNKSDSDYTFEMKKTDIADVYILNIVEIEISDDQSKLKRLKRKKAGIALIPNVMRSKWCMDKISDNADENVLVVCKYHHDKHKWEPIDISKNKRPSFITDFDLDYVEE